MAKVENVKVIDVVAGEFKKVEINGVELINVTDVRKPVEGNYILVLEQDEVDITANAFYRIDDVCSYDDEVTFMDDEGDDRDRYIEKGSYELFATENTFTQFKIGDNAVIFNNNKHTEPKVSKHLFDEGEVVKITGKNGTYKDIYHVKNAKGTMWNVHAGDLQFITEEEANELKRSKVKVEIGDVVIVADFSAGHKVGTIGIAQTAGQADSILVEANGSKYWEEVDLVVRKADRLDTK